MAQSMAVVHSAHGKTQAWPQTVGQKLQRSMDMVHFLLTKVCGRWLSRLPLAVVFFRQRVE